jgi:hypothetical protein
MPNIVINTFNAGILTPEMDCRTDVDKFAAGCRDLDNMIPLVFGCAQRRPGTKFIYASSAPVFGSSGDLQIEFHPVGEIVSGDDYGGIIFDSTDTRTAQTFTTVDEFTITAVKVIGSRTGSPGDVTVEIKAVDINGEPTGSALASGSASFNAIAVEPLNEWVQIDIDSPVVLSATTQYAIIFSQAVYVTGDDVGYIWRKMTDPVYTGGYVVVSGDGGSTWTVFNDPESYNALLFETYGVLT